MKICVYGLWHLGTVTATCVAESGFETIGLSENATDTAALVAGHPPLFEPGLAELLAKVLANGKLTITDNIEQAASASDIIWVTFDTPVDDEDRADSTYVCAQIEKLFPHVNDGAIILVSSQLPVGSIAQLEQKCRERAPDKGIIFACSPENLRLGKALDVFRHPERIVVGLRDGAGKEKLAKLFKPFCTDIIWIGIEAAELSKHAINAYLATCVTFINEIATVAEKVGADAGEVERAMRSEPRIGPKAYIRPGAAFAGGTLARDVTFLGEIATSYGLPLKLINSILESNRAHSTWPLRRLQDKIGSLRGCVVTVLGLSYKPGTDTLRRSLAVRLVKDLAESGAQIIGYDPCVHSLPHAPAAFSMAGSAKSALKGSDALVLMTEWPDFRSLTVDDVTHAMRTPLVLDQNCFLTQLGGDSRISYLSTGKSK